MYFSTRKSCNINQKWSILNHIRTKEVKPDPKTLPN